MFVDTLLWKICEEVYYIDWKQFKYVKTFTSTAMIYGNQSSDILFLESLVHKRKHEDTPCRQQKHHVYEKHTPNQQHLLQHSSMVICLICTQAFF